MRQIELTEEHKEKLLEMAKKLFPEYKRIEITDYQIDIDRNHTNPIFVDLYKGELTVPFDIYSIHWFEFCMTHLAEKIINPKDENTSKIKKKYENLYTDTMANWWFMQDPGLRESFALDPINWLYKEFKKLN